MGRKAWRMDDSAVARFHHCEKCLARAVGGDALTTLARTSGAVTTDSGNAARFVLQVWNSSLDWAALAMAPPSEEGLGLEGVELEPFNILQSLTSWDSEHERAFQSWVELPFWP
jgi:hypothetical protein